MCKKTKNWHPMTTTAGLVHVQTDKYENQKNNKGSKTSNLLEMENGEKV
jgi:hypothetical protein